LKYSSNAGDKSGLPCITGYPAQKRVPPLLTAGVTNSTKVRVPTLYLPCTFFPTLYFSYKAKLYYLYYSSPFPSTVWIRKKACFFCLEICLSRFWRPNAEMVLVAVGCFLAFPIQNNFAENSPRHRNPLGRKTHRIDVGGYMRGSD
jgi:hypothetical protein